jgi:hypothetical protein
MSIMNHVKSHRPEKNMNNEYHSRPLDFTKITRQILSNKPRVTRFFINWPVHTKIRLKRIVMRIK